MYVGKDVRCVNHDVIKLAPDSKNHEVAEEYLRQVGGSLGFPLNSIVFHAL